MRLGVSIGRKRYVKDNEKICKRVIRALFRVEASTQSCILCMADNAGFKRKKTYHIPATEEERSVKLILTN
jgi:hypothetical protein